MKKILKSLLLSACVCFTGIMGANAASSANVTCKDNYLGIGESTTCTVKAKTDSASVSGFIAFMSTSKYLNITNITPNAGWTAATNTTNTSDINELRYAFTYNSTAENAAVITPNAEFEVFSFTLTVSKEAKNLPAGDCGQMCLTGAAIDSASKNVTIEGGTSCPSITIDTDETKPSNPNTGTFANYAMLAGCAGVAIITISIINKKNKFYRV